MKDLLLTPTGDLYISPTGDIALTDSVRQAILIRLRWFAGEWRFQPELGLPYFEQVLVKNPNLSQIRQLILEQILDVKEVAAVPKLELNMDRFTRQLKINFTAISGKEEINEEVRIDAQMGDYLNRL